MKLVSPLRLKLPEQYDGTDIQHLKRGVVTHKNRASPYLENLQQPAVISNPMETESRVAEWMR